MSRASIELLIDEVFAKALGAPLVPATPTCGRCEVIATAAEKRGDQRTPVNLAESWYAPNGRKYFAGLCAECTDLEWSGRWDARYAAAPSPALLEEVKRFEKRGRTYLGTKRPGGATVPRAQHTPGCRCSKCREPAEDDRSLFPPGYASNG